MILFEKMLNFGELDLFLFCVRLNNSIYWMAIAHMFRNYAWVWCLGWKVFLSSCLSQAHSHLWTVYVVHLVFFPEKKCMSISSSCCIKQPCKTSISSVSWEPSVFSCWVRVRPACSSMLSTWFGVALPVVVTDYIFFALWIQISILVVTGRLDYHFHR